MLTQRTQPSCRRQHVVMIFGQRRQAAAARRHPDSLADSRLTRQLFAYEMLAERRNQQDSMLWQAPALALTAQAFLLTIALGGNAVSVFARALAAGLGLVVACMSMQLMAKHRHLTELDNAWLAAMEQEIGLAPIAVGVDNRSPRYKSRRGPAAFSGPPGPKLCGLGGRAGPVRPDQRGDLADYSHPPGLL